MAMVCFSVIFERKPPQVLSCFLEAQRMIWFMEELLRIEADIKYFVGIEDRSHQRWLMDELLKIVEEAELLFGPRDRSYELLEPRITERAFGQAFEVSPRDRYWTLNGPLMDAN